MEMIKKIKDMEKGGEVNILYRNMFNIYYNNSNGLFKIFHKDNYCPILDIKIGKSKKKK